MVIRELRRLRALRSSPLNLLSIPEEPAGRPIIAKGREPDDGVGALFDRTWCRLAAHVCPDPAWIDGIHEYAGSTICGREYQCQRVEGGFRRRVRRRIGSEPR